MSAVIRKIEPMLTSAGRRRVAPLVGILARVDRFTVSVRTTLGLKRLCAACILALWGAGNAAAFDPPKTQNPAPKPPANVPGTPTPTPAPEPPASTPPPETTPPPASAPPPATTQPPATPGPPATRAEQSRSYHEFRNAYDTKRYADARPLAERAVAITEELDGKDSVALITPLNNLALAAYRLKDYAAAEEAYLRSIKIIETRQASSPRLPHTLYALGRVYVAADQREFAVTMFKRAVDITRKTDGLFTINQLSYLIPLIDAYIAAGKTADADREEQYLTNISIRNYSQQDPKFIAAIERQAQWQERQGKYVMARHLYAQAIEFTRRSGDIHDIRQVNQLRGLARCYRMEFLFGAVDAEQSASGAQGFEWGAPVSNSGQSTHLDMEGERLLQEALKLAESATAAGSQALKRDTLIDLGDWNWVANASKTALKYYADAWALLTLAERNAADASNPLGQPFMLGYLSPRIATKKANAKPDDYEEKFVDIEFTVTAQGKVENIKTVKSDAIESQQRLVMSAMHHAIYRPRIVDGKPVQTEGVHFHETVFPKR